MMEILVVVGISLLIAAISLPSFVKSMQGSRLRTSGRAVVTSHKYARNMAVLRQSQMALIFDRQNRVIEVVSVPSRDSLSERGGFLEARAKGIENEAPMETYQQAGDGEEEAGEVAPAQMTLEESRPLAKGVEISDFSTEAKDAESTGVYWVNYYPSGMSDGFEVRLLDDRNKSVTIKSDKLSGGIEVVSE